MRLSKAKIHDAIRSAVVTATFRPVTYDINSGTMNIDTGNQETAKTVIINEVAATFRQNASRNRQTLTHDRDTWTWELHLKFDVEVMLEDFERSITRTPIRIAKDDAEGNRNIWLELRDARYSHPPRFESASGTQVVYTLLVHLQPF